MKSAFIGRALSDAEIWSIYNDSASTTNRLIGKFDPSVTPAYGLAEALVDFGGATNVIFGVNDQWELYSYTFIAASNSMPLAITGLEPGMLLDQFSVSQAPVTNLYYLPEQSLDELNGDSAYGNWTLQIWDNRTDALLPPDGVLDSWTLQMVLQTNTPPTVDLSPQTPLTITVPPGDIVPLYVAVPNWANMAANMVDSNTGPVDVLFNPSVPPTGGAGDTVLSNNVLTTTPVQVGPTLTSFSTPPLPGTPTNFYYLGVRNDTTHAVNATIEVDFNVPTLTNGVPYTSALGLRTPFYTGPLENYFVFNVTNGYEATFQLLKLSGEADLVVSKGTPLPTLYSSAYGSFNVSNADQNIYVLTNSSPVPLSPGPWYLGVIRRDNGPVSYTVLAKELATNAPPAINITPLTDNVPFQSTIGPGADLTNFFSFTITNSLVSGVRFELYDMTGNGDLTAQPGAPPFAPPFFQSSQEPGLIPEFIQIQTNSALTNLATTWYLGVPNHETNVINFTIVAEIDTNGAFPAFPGAQGAGAGAVGGGGPGGFNTTVYHVTSLNDDGSYGTLRDAVSSTNRTIVFDLSGVIFLQSPLIITNSFLTIAGQTAPGGGITVAGQMTELQSVHDVIVRDVRFRSGGAPLTGFETVSAGDYTSGQTVGTWTVKSNQVSVVADAPNAERGSNYLALANGTILTNVPTIPGSTYELTLAYRGPGLVHWWRGESNTVDTIEGINGHFASAGSGSVAYTTGEDGAGFMFTGNAYVGVPYSPTLQFTNSFTLETWFEDLGSAIPPGYELISEPGS